MAYPPPIGRKLSRPQPCLLTLSRLIWSALTLSLLTVVGCRSGTVSSRDAVGKGAAVAPDYRLTPTSLEGTPVEKDKLFEIWLLESDKAEKPAKPAKPTKPDEPSDPKPSAPTPSSAVPPGAVRLGTTLIRKHRNRGELLYSEETKTVQIRGPSLLTTWRKTVFVETDGGQPVRFTVHELEQPSRSSRVYSGTLADGKLKLITGEAADRQVKLVEVPAGAVSPQQLRRDLLARGLENIPIGRALRVEVGFPIPQEPESPHPLEIGVLEHRTVDFDGRTVPVFAVILLVHEVFGKTQGRIEYMDAAGEVFGMEERYGNAKIIWRRIK